MYILVDIDKFVDIQTGIQPIDKMFIPDNNVKLNRSVVMFKDTFETHDNNVTVADVNRKGQIAAKISIPSEWFDGQVEMIKAIPRLALEADMQLVAWLNLPSVRPKWINKNLQDLLKEDFFPTSIHVLASTPSTLSLLVREYTSTNCDKISLLIVDSLKGIVYTPFSLYEDEMLNMCTEMSKAMDDF